MRSLLLGVLALLLLAGPAAATPPPEGCVGIDVLGVEKVVCPPERLAQPTADALAEACGVLGRLLDASIEVRCYHDGMVDVIVDHQLLA